MTLPEALRAAEAHLAAGRAGEAIGIWRAILAAQPANLQALTRLAMTLKALGKNADAAEVFARLLPHAGQSFEIQASHGQVLQALGQFDAAIARYRRALELQPGFAPIWSTMGALLLMQGQVPEAEAALRRALQLQPDAADVHNNLGVLLRDQGKHADAVPLFRRALQLQPGANGTRFNLGVSLLRLANHAEAEQLFRQVLAAQPGDAAIHNNLAAALNGQKKYAEAELALRQALQLQPGDAAVHANLGLALLNQAKYAEAEAVLRRAQQLNPNDAQLTSNLGIALLNQGKHGDAGQIVEEFLVRFPHALAAFSPMLYAMQCDAHCPVEKYLAAARQYGAAALAQARPLTQWRVPAPGSALPQLRVGLVSGDMRTHPVGYFLENLVANIDPQRVQLVGYTTRAQEDALTARIKPHFCAWHDISLLNDEMAANRIRDDGIHVLVDLAGHTTHNRLPLFAWKPAPLQVAWLGYFASTGVPGMDYILVDPVSVKAEECGQFTEDVWYLPDTRLCYTPPAAAGMPAPPPVLAGKHITFGTYQNMVKITDPVLALWSRVLARVEGARLRVQNAEMHFPAARSLLLSRLAQAGVPAERVELVGYIPRDAYFASYGQVDILLDTFPYPGGTTTCEALWMGVPTLTLRGNTLLSRQGASLLSAVGLEAWIAADEEDYVRRAVSFAGDTTLLATLRQSLREQMQHSPLCDGKRFAAAFADALHGMWCSKTQ